MACKNRKSPPTWFLRWVSLILYQNFYSQIKKIRNCFNSLDKDGSGQIGWQELKDPLIGMGLSENI